LLLDGGKKKKAVSNSRKKLEVLQRQQEQGSKRIGKLIARETAQDRNSSGGVRFYTEKRKKRRFVINELDGKQESDVVRVYSSATTRENSPGFRCK